mmetsp:Transcript_9726/g.23924  ORF Transcript_9726/g.23924 Transcript_9726/m.23924 type:complete len:201 (-) Transcript_9726:536-1138(-)
MLSNADSCGLSRFFAFPTPPQAELPPPPGLWADSGDSGGAVVAAAARAEPCAPPPRSRGGGSRQAGETFGAPPPLSKEGESCGPFTGVPQERIFGEAPENFFPARCGGCPRPPEPLRGVLLDPDPGSISPSLARNSFPARWPRRAFFMPLSSREKASLFPSLARCSGSSGWEPARASRAAICFSRFRSSLYRRLTRRSTR